MEPLVFALAYFWAQMNCECERLNSYEIQIEQRVKVCTQEEPILHMIIQITAVSLNMSRFQHV